LKSKCHHIIKNLATRFSRGNQFGKRDKQKDNIYQQVAKWGKENDQPPLLKPQEMKHTSLELPQGMKTPS